MRKLRYSVENINHEAKNHSISDKKKQRKTIAVISITKPKDKNESFISIQKIPSPNVKLYHRYNVRTLITNTTDDY